MLFRYLPGRVGLTAGELLSAITDGSRSVSLNDVDFCTADTYRNRNKIKGGPAIKPGPLL